MCCPRNIPDFEDILKIPTPLKENAAKKEYESCLADIMSLTGIGRKVADCILLHSMSFRQAVPLGIGETTKFIAR